MKKLKLRNNILEAIIVFVMINVVTMLVWISLRLVPVLNVVDEIKEKVNRNAINEIYENEKELLKELEFYEKDNDLEFSVIHKGIEINKYQSNEKEFLVLSQMIEINDEYYFISGYYQKIRGALSLFFELLGLELAIILIYIMIIYMLAKTKIIEPIEHIITDVKNYKLGLKPKKKKSLDNEFGLLQNDFFELMDSLEYEKNEQRRIIASISHDIKTPLTSIIGYSSLINDSDLTTKSYEEYGRLDLLGRCTEVSASVGKDLMPTEERGNIGMIKPTGWHTVKYQGIDGNYLYNRCHLIGFQLTGENANERNLITGTRYMNVQGMLPFENMIADYVKETNNHVLYRVTPIFEGANLLASGVLMEAKSVEDDGKGVMFNVYCYNVQPGVEINYATGASTGPEFTGSTTTTTTEKTQPTTPVVTPVVVPTTPKEEQKQENPATPTVPEQKEETPVVSQNQISYVANKNTKKFHYSDCPSVKQMSDKNKVYITATSEEMKDKGYSPCGNCNP